MEHVPHGEFIPDSPPYERLISQVGVVLSSYYENVLFHGWDHAVDTRFTGRRFWRLALANDLPVNPLAIDLGALVHDAGLSHPAVKAFPSAEAYSAYIAGKIYPKFDIPIATIATTQEIVLDTRSIARPTTINGLILRVSDVINVADPYERMFEGFVRIMGEYEMAHDGEALPVREGRRKQVTILRQYFGQPPRELEGYDLSCLGLEQIYTDANSNIRRLELTPLDELTDQFEAVRARLPLAA